MSVYWVKLFEIIIKISICMWLFLPLCEGGEEWEGG